jgi:hypothetical protein
VNSVEKRREFSLVFEMLKEFTRPGFHGGGAGLEGFFEELFCFGTPSRVVLGKFGEGLQSESAHDRTAVIEIAAESRDCALAFRWGELETWNHLGEVPAEFDLRGFSEQAEQLGFVAVEEARLLRGNFFGGVGRAHADGGIVVPEAGDEFAEELWLFQNEFDRFVSAADGAPVGACEY